jgi:tripeptide aminopeptidase
LETTVVERFIRYVKIDTQSDPASTSTPSTAKQLDLARILVDELKEIGLSEVGLDTNGVVMATLPANRNGTPTIGFIAHMDTSPDMSGSNVNPQIVEYHGGDLVLNQKEGVVLSPSEFPDLHKYIGQTLITTDGTTLLGADNKAGVAEIMASMAYLTAHPEIPHGTIRVGFTPDEEIGRGADHFDVAKFNADFAYTLDGGEIGELQYENFNAANATIKIRGRNVHPGTAKDKMINALQVGIDLHNQLPVNKRPEFSDHYEGFLHLTHFSGIVDQADIRYILREHDRQKYELLKDELRRAVDFINARYGDGTVMLDLKDSYFNMKEKIEPVMYIIELARQAMLDTGIEPLVRPIRGGTDGARLSYMGLPCPNIFTGGHNYHGRYEFIPVLSMHKAVEVVVRIAELAAKI